MAFGPQTAAERELVARIRADTPDWPTEAVEGWLFEIAKGYGWPPDERWHYALNRRPFDRWAAVRWARQAIDPATLRTVPAARQMITGLIGAYGGAQNDYSNIENSRVRIEGLAVYIAQHGTWPVAPLLQREGEAFGILDGSHRFSALFLVQQWRARRMIAAEPPLHETHQVVVATMPADW